MQKFFAINGWFDAVDIANSFLSLFDGLVV